MTQATNINVNPELVSEKSIGKKPFLVLNPCINIFISNCSNGLKNIINS